MKFIILSLLLSAGSFARAHDHLHRPKSFSTHSGTAVFVDFKSAIYDITYNAETQKATAVATIEFEAPETGKPVFDVVEPPTSLILDGEKVGEFQTRTPSSETALRVINKVVEAGTHTMVVEVPINTLVEFYGKNGVKSAFWTSDLEERRFLERYLPASFEYDQVKMTFNIHFEGITKTQNIFTNGVVREMKKNNKTFFQISYPSHFNSSSIFFHTVPIGMTEELNFSLKSIDGRDIPSVVYVSKANGDKNDLQLLKKLTTDIFHELEADYGPWPHPSLVIYNAGLGGMEYCGATMTSAKALGHELFHSYFARGVMPANGNAGWIDEALASWRDNGYRNLSFLLGSGRMSNQPTYTRSTDRAAYSFGERFMSFMDGKLKSKGGLKPFMRHMVEYKKFSPFLIDEFISEMTNFYGVDVSGDFRKYTFGPEKFSLEKSEESKIHRKMSIEELKSYL